MSLFSSLTLIITVIIVYYFLFLIYSVLFRITGISKEKARFQTITLLTSVGYSTGESEIITGDKTRRAIAKSAMLTGYFFSVVIVSLVINMFLSIDFSRINSNLVTLLSGFAILVLFFIIMSIPAVKKKIDDEIDIITVKLFKHTAKENFISVIDSYGNDAVCKVFLYKVPEKFNGKKIIDTNIKSFFNINILILERKGQVKYVTKDTIFSNNDTLLVFGPLESIRKAFLLKDWNSKDSERGEVVKNRNEIGIIENYDYQVLAEIQLNVVPAILRDKSLVESKIKDYFSINVMMVSRSGSPININKDTLLEENDHVIAFGPYENIQTVFGEKG